MPETHGRDDGGSVDDHESSSQPPEKKQRQARRALSCTECKRRKTKCSALGKTPCDACVRRGRPGECVWIDAEAHNGPAYALTADLDSLRRQVEELKELLQVQITTTAGVLARIAEAAPVSAVPQAAHGTPRTTSSGAASGPAGTSAGSVAAHDSGEASVGRRASTTRMPRSAVETTLKGFEASVVGTLPGTRFVGPGSVVRNAASIRRGDATAAPRATALERAYALLPPVDLGRAIVDEYFRGPLNRGWPIVEEVTFRQKFDEYMSFKPLEGTMDQMSWLAVYLMMLASTTKMNHHMRRFSNHDPSDLPLALYFGAMDCLDAADYLTVPQIRHLQVVVMSLTFHFHFADVNAQGNIALRNVDAAISTCQWLELDILEDDPAALPADDAALVGLSPVQGLELVKRLVHYLCFADGTFQKRLGLWRWCHNLKTPFPGNYIDLWHLDDERPLTELTSATLPRIGSAFATTIAMYHRPEGFSYETMLAYDQALRRVLDQLPTTTGPLSSYWMMHMINCSIHNRILRLHRPYMFPRHTDLIEALDAQASARAAVHSSRRIIEIQLIFNDNPLIRPRFVHIWILGAVLVLAIDYVSGSRESRTSLLQSLEIFNQSYVSPDDSPYATGIGSRDIMRQCAQAVDAMLAVADDRLERGITPTDEGGMNGYFARVADRISATEQQHAVDVLPYDALAALFPDLSDFEFSFLTASGGQ
ncbi:uncharacterized protein LOC62_02G003439 [Vanrija pseudolonga]|uniref:Zn(2)-C6 fungal-type domain-containing protein n=1 Tax=Vanrija pseudolonga TaxID=143232 RepID=A0AAF0Y4D7_9TREE|nr:hypothetical protein LOC62_02G003439 [Vanrija pseudolonga]